MPIACLKRVKLGSPINLCSLAHAICAAVNAERTTASRADSERGSKMLAAIAAVTEFKSCMFFIDVTLCLQSLNSFEGLPGVGPLSTKIGASIRVGGCNGVVEMSSAGPSLYPI